jgi:hypothetical protein
MRPSLLHSPSPHRIPSVAVSIPSFFLWNSVTPQTSNASSV